VVKFRIKHPEFDNVPIIVETETNSRFDGDIIEKHLLFEKAFELTEKPIGKIDFAQDESIKRRGVIKTYQRTRSYVFQFNQMLSSSKFRFLSNTTTAHPTLSSRRILREAKDELARFCWPDVDSENIRYSTRRSGPSGKLQGKNDDMCIAILMLVYFSITRRVERIAIEAYEKTRNTTNLENNSRYLQRHAFREYGFTSVM
jgi:hypothetical protein